MLSDAKHHWPIVALRVTVVGYFSTAAVAAVAPGCIPNQSSPITMIVAAPAANNT